jgi:hypothetical protein
LALVEVEDSEGGMHGLVGADSLGTLLWDRVDIELEAVETSCVPA